MSPRLGRLLVVPSLLLALGLAGCGDDESDAATPSGPKTSGTPSATGTAAPEAGECPAVVPAEAIGSLGWTGTDGAVEDRGGCFVEAEQGTVLVLQVGETYDEACTRLRDAAPAGTFRPMLENPAGLDACGYVQDGDLGQSEAVLVDDQDRVISIGVAATEPTPPGDVRDTLLALTRSAASLP